MECSRIVFSGHAVRRMFERQIRESDVRSVIEVGHIVAEYQDDLPFSSYLILGFAGQLPLHVVVAVDAAGRTCHVVTVYVPDTEIWHSDYRTRRKS